MRDIRLLQKFSYGLYAWTACCFLKIDGKSWTIFSKAGGRGLFDGLFASGVLSDIERKRLDLEIDKSEMTGGHGDGQSGIMNDDDLALACFAVKDPPLLRTGRSRIADAIGVFRDVDYRFLFWYLHAAVTSQAMAIEAGAAESVLPQSTQMTICGHASSRGETRHNAVGRAIDCLVRAASSLSVRDRETMNLLLVEAILGLDREDRERLAGLMEREELGAELDASEIRIRNGIFKRAIELLPSPRRKRIEARIDAIIQGVAREAGPVRTLRLVGPVLARR